MEFVKINEEDYAERGVIGLPDQPGLTTLEMQKKFDELSLEVIIPKFNKLSGELDVTLFPTYNIIQIMAKQGWTANDILKKSTIDIAGVMDEKTRVYFQFDDSSCITTDIVSQIGKGAGVCEIVKYSNSRIYVGVVFTTSITTETPQKYLKLVSGSNDRNFDRCLTEADFTVEGDDIIFNWL